MFKLIMKIKNKHSVLLQSLGLSKEFVRNYSPIHALLVKLAVFVGKRGA